MFGLSPRLIVALAIAIAFAALGAWAEILRAQRNEARAEAAQFRAAYDHVARIVAACHAATTAMERAAADARARGAQARTVADHQARLHAAELDTHRATIARLSTSEGRAAAAQASAGKTCSDAWREIRAGTLATEVVK